MKIQANCPVCERDYLGPNYTIPNLCSDDPHLKDPEAYSDFAYFLNLEPP